MVGETLLVLQIFEKRLAGAGEANDRVGEARDFLVEVVGGEGGSGCHVCMGEWIDSILLILFQ